jgi:hypothetical protein
MGNRQRRKTVDLQHSQGGGACMKEYSNKLLNKALDAIEAAEALLNIDKA